MELDCISGLPSGSKSNNVDNDKIDEEILSICQH